MNLPSRSWGRFNATMPLAVLTVGPDKVSLHLHGINRAVSTSNLRSSWWRRHLPGILVDASEIMVAYRLKGELLTSGVGLELSDGRVVYFWTLRDQDRVLIALGRSGITIDSVPRPARTWPFQRPSC